MARLVVFVFFCVSVVLVLSLNGNKSLKVNNSKFDFEAAKSEHLAKVKEIKELEVARTNMNKVQEEKEEVVVEGPKVALDTPTLKAGHEVYTNKGKCLVCHGKYAEGKKSQKAPKLAGQYAWYLKQQLEDMKSGARVNKAMNPYLKKLNAEDLANVAEYISKFSW